MCRILGRDRGSDERDVRRVIAEGRAFNLPEQERAEYLMISPEFRMWFTARESKAMLVNGNSDHDPISPMSFACALLSDSARLYPGPITLSFFCGLHADSRRGETGAQSMLADLIGQLLEHYQSLDLSFLEPAQQPALEAHETDILVDLFVALVRQLPAGRVVFCIVDGISYFEYSDKTKACSKVVMALAGLVDDDEVHAVFKVLIASPSISRSCNQYLARKDVFNLPDVIAHSNQGFDGTGFRRVARGQIEELKAKVHEDAHPEAEWDISSEEQSDS